jgi:UDP-glucuronate 4-epimerase
MAEYLVTGAAGFIGAALVQKLLDQGNQVTGFDNLNEAYDSRLKRWRLDRLSSRPGFFFRQLDISDPQALEAGWATSRFDAVFNLAARAGVRASMKDPGLYFAANTTGALNVLEAARRHGVKKVVQASTSSLYGKHNPRPYAETADISRPLSPYAASKGAAELLCHTYHYLYDLDITILRYFTVFGPAGRPDMSIFRFIQWIAEEQPLRIYGDGGQERDFTFVDDIVEGTVAAARPLGFEIINLGSDRPVPLREVVRILERLMDREARLEILPEAPGDVRSTWADITRARERLDWSPQTGLEAGLERCIAWYTAERAWARTIPTLD